MDFYRYQVSFRLIPANVLSNKRFPFTSALEMKGIIPVFLSVQTALAGIDSEYSGIKERIRQLDVPFLLYLRHSSSLTCKHAVLPTASAPLHVAGAIRCTALFFQTKALERIMGELPSEIPFSA